MPTAVTLKGLLEPVTLEDDFVDTLNALNMSAAQGREFIVTRNNDGEKVGFAMNNIVFLQELDE